MRRPHQRFPLRAAHQVASHDYCGCEWDGAVWPFAISQTLNALANVLRDYRSIDESP